MRPQDTTAAEVLTSAHETKKDEVKEQDVQGSTEADHGDHCDEEEAAAVVGSPRSLQSLILCLEKVTP